MTIKKPASGAEVTEVPWVPLKPLDGGSDISTKEPEEKEPSKVLTGLKLAAGAVFLGPAILAGKLGEKVRDALSDRDEDAPELAVNKTEHFQCCRSP